MLFILVLILGCNKEIGAENDQTLSSKKIKTYSKEIKATLNNWITLLNESKYREFIREFKTPYEVGLLRESGDFDDLIDDLKFSGLNEFIMQLEDLLKEDLIINPDYVSFEKSDMKLCKIDGKWYQYFDINLVESVKKRQSNRQSIIADLNNLAASALAFYKTPATNNGGGQSWSSNIDNVGNWLGYGYNSTTKSLSTNNGSFIISINRDILTIVGIGNEIGNDEINNIKATISVTGKTSRVKTTINN